MTDVALRLPAEFEGDDLPIVSVTRIVHIVSGRDQVVVRFRNGWGASVVTGPESYGGPEGLFELTVLNADPCIPLAPDGVVGWLDPAGVRGLFAAIAALPPETVALP
jgi:hypothetical protein